MTMTTIGLVCGDPSGVGPELSAKLIRAKVRDENLRIAVFSGLESLEDGYRIAGMSGLEVPVVDSVKAIPDRPGAVLVQCGDDRGYSPGVASAEGGVAVLSALEAVAQSAVAGEIDAIVYGPLNKQAMWLAGHKAIDELHFFKERLGVSGFCCELNKQGELWTTRVTSHIPLRLVTDNISVDTIVAATEAGVQAFEAAQKRRPRIAIAGLNPHLGEGGAMGREEIDVIMPAIKALRARGHDVAGLYPADTVFLRIASECIDVVVTMFHDQGQIALKALGFANTSTVLGGLPLPVVTASQGTAYDIVGRNLADPTGLINAFELAHQLAVSRGKKS
ncbi:4-hydroxythreonine-4-phosphate dehydrogenase PdxA [Phyllobacterium sp. SB3]|uniref:4-hydroxythreonine-4-phosphate dehydrogenase PdxA n=1 Tax=Phyllobacterium sp. SB3 TaxID=3156073 RepID=UPI0032AEA4AB